MSEKVNEQGYLITQGEIISDLGDRWVTVRKITKQTKHMNQQAQPTKEMSTLEALKFAIQALNRPANFNTWIPKPNQVRGRAELKSYDLLSMLDAVVRREEEGN